MGNKRILFVDDEQSILDGLRRMLRGQRREWQMSFASSGAEALELLAGSPCDVIVTDMRMPGMDGAELLKTVAERHPRVVRLMLSGHSEAEAAMRAVPVAHQFLSKPCDAERLRATVQRACALEDLLGREDLRSAIGGVESLPALPSGYSELTAALVDEDYSLGDVAAIVERDPGLSAKVLQVVNSSFFGLPQTMASVQQAVSYLGMQMIQSLALTIEVFHDLGKDGTTVDADGLGAHSLATAGIARRLVDDRHAAADAFTAAILHDTGKLLIAAKLPAEQAEIARRAAAGERPRLEVEVEVLGVGHAEVGAYLLGIWGLPYPIVEAVANHHHPGRIEQQSFGVLGAVHVANALAHEVAGDSGDDGGGGGEAAALDHAYLARLGVADSLPAWRALAEKLLLERVS